MADDNTPSVSADAATQAAAALSAVANSLSEVVTKMNSTLQSLSENVAKMSAVQASLSENVAKQSAGEDVQESTATTDKFRGSTGADTRFVEKDAHSTSTSLGSDHTSVKHDSDVETTETISAFMPQIISDRLGFGRAMDAQIVRLTTNAISLDERAQNNAVTYDNAVAIGNLTVDALVKALQNLSPSVVPSASKV